MRALGLERRGRMRRPWGAGDKAFAACFDVSDKRWVAVLAALRSLQEGADVAQKDLVRSKLR